MSKGNALIVHPTANRRKTWKRLGKLVLGWSFIVLGVLGLVLPILQGFLFLGIGFTILAPEYPWAQRQMERLRARHPELAATFDSAKERALRIVKRCHFNGNGDQKESQDNDRDGGAKAA